MQTRASIKPQRATAFTLIELLVVISIIALLVALLLPAIKQSRSVARSIQCAAKLRQLGIAVSVYQGDNNGFFPAAWQRGRGANGHNYDFEGRTTWMYILAQDVFGFPSDAMKGNREAHICPEAPERDHMSYINTGYGWNYIHLTFGYGVVQDNPFFYPRDNGELNGLGRTQNLDIVAKPSSTLMMADSGINLGPTPDGEVDYMVAWWNGGYHIYSGVEVSLHRVPEPRHMGVIDTELVRINKVTGRANVCFVDGHVDSKTFEEAKQKELFVPP